MRYQASSRAPTPVDSMVLARVSGAGQTWIGEIEHIVLYSHQADGAQELFAYVRWLKPSLQSFEGTPWQDIYRAFSLQAWEPEVFLNPSTGPSPSSVVALSDLLAPVARHTVNLHGHKTCITLPLHRSPAAVLT
ncbi:hypothetical protein C2E23DRAFT_99790 [Lenzites betulinus]|nr:hypothetical protein C2E23DRAFT_99790 [Lenzites betulinus]